MSTRRLRVDMDDILDAMDSYGDAPEAYLNLETGVIDYLLDPMITGVEPEIDPMDEAWEQIPRCDARDEYQEMERFAESLDEEDVRAELDLALAGKGAFRRFRFVLSRHPDLQSRWEAEKRQRLLERALEWLADLGIDPEYPDLRSVPLEPVPPPPPQQRPGLFDLLLLGAPEGKTELIEGRVHRAFVARDPGRARRVFADVARELTEIDGVGWRKRFIEGRNDYQVGRCHLSVSENVVHLEVEVPRAIWDAFAG